VELAKKDQDALNEKTVQIEALFSSIENAVPET
jgi:hypothetical protein